MQNNVANTLYNVATRWLMRGGGGGGGEWSEAGSSLEDAPPGPPTAAGPVSLAVGVPLVVVAPGPDVGSMVRAAIIPRLGALQVALVGATELPPTVVMVRLSVLGSLELPPGGPVGIPWFLPGVHPAAAAAAATAGAGASLGVRSGTRNAPEVVGGPTRPVDQMVVPVAGALEVPRGLALTILIVLAVILGSRVSAGLIRGGDDVIDILPVDIVAVSAVAVFVRYSQLSIIVANDIIITPGDDGVGVSDIFFMRVNKSVSLRDSVHT